MPKTTKNLSVCQEEEEDTLEDAVTEVSNNHQSTTEEEARALLTAFPEILSSAAGEKIETKECTGPPPSKEYSDNAFQAFKQEYVQAAVEEAMDHGSKEKHGVRWGRPNLTPGQQRSHVHVRIQGDVRPHTRME